MGTPGAALGRHSAHDAVLLATTSVVFMKGSTKQMRIGILGGTGPQGRGLALRLAIAGFSVALGSRVPERAQAEASRLRERARALRPEPAIIGAGNREVSSQSDALILAVPFAAARETIAETVSSAPAAALWVDVTVPLGFRGGRVTVSLSDKGSASEELALLLPHPKSLVAAFKTVPASSLVDLANPLDCDVFVCGDSTENKTRVIDVISRIRGLRAVDVGPLSCARPLEAMTALLIGINRGHGVKSAHFRLMGL